MAKFTINRGYGGEQTVESERYYTNGEFIDFVNFNEEDGIEETVLRIKASLVKTVHMEEAPK